MKLSITLCAVGLVIAMLYALPTTAQVYQRKKKEDTPLIIGVKTNPLNLSKDRYNLGLEAYFQRLRIAVNVNASVWMPTKLNAAGFLYDRSMSNYYAGIRWYPFGKWFDLLEEPKSGCPTWYELKQAKRSPLFAGLGLQYNDASGRLDNLAEELSEMSSLQSLNLIGSLGLRCAVGPFFAEVLSTYRLHQFKGNIYGDTSSLLTFFKDKNLSLGLNVGYTF